jgi:hypothetical protein
LALRTFLRHISRVLVVAIALVIAVASCGGGGSPTSPSSATSSSTSSGLGITTYTYTTDIKPILSSDCVSCHGPSRQENGYNFSTYQGVLRAVVVGSDQSPLVRVTGPGGLMYGELSGNRAQKSQVIYDWVVNSHAAE